MKTRVYLDNCCLNRPFDDPSTTLVRLEAEAKRHVQQQILLGLVELAWSFVLEHENADNPYEDRKRAITPWQHKAVIDVGPNEEAFQRALAFEKCKIKSMDALHIACAIIGKCHYFLTTDKKLLNKRVEGIVIMNPMDYILKVEGKR